MDNESTNKLIGSIFKQVRERKGLTQDVLANITGLTRSWIESVEQGGIGEPGSRKLQTLLKTLGLTYQDIDIIVNAKPEERLGLIVALAEISESRAKGTRYEPKHIELISVPVRGILPCGTPFPEEETTGGIIEVPLSELRNANLKKIYALRVSGDSLRGNAEPGEYVIIDPTQLDVINGKLYVVETEGSVCGRRVYQMNDHIRLVSPNPAYKDMVIKSSEAKIQGRIITYGGWKVD